MTDCEPWTNNAAPIVCLFQTKEDVSAKGHAHVMLIYDEPLLSGHEPPLSGHLLVPQGWLLNGDSVVI